MGESNLGGTISGVLLFLFLAWAGVGNFLAVYDFIKHDDYVVLMNGDKRSTHSAFVVKNSDYAKLDDTFNKLPANAVFMKKSDIKADYTKGVYTFDAPKDCKQRDAEKVKKVSCVQPLDFMPSNAKILPNADKGACGNSGMLFIMNIKDCKAAGGQIYTADGVCRNAAGTQQYCDGTKCYVEPEHRRKIHYLMYAAFGLFVSCGLSALIHTCQISGTGQPLYRWRFIYFCLCMFAQFPLVFIHVSRLDDCLNLTDRSYIQKGHMSYFDDYDYDMVDVLVILWAGVWGIIIIMNLLGMCCTCCQPWDDDGKLKCQGCFCLLNIFVSIMGLIAFCGAAYYSAIVTWDFIGQASDYDFDRTLSLYMGVVVYALYNVILIFTACCCNDREDKGGSGHNNFAV